MTKGKPHKTLRKKAEQIAQRESTGLTEEEQFDLLLLAQELETTQIELEAQNEQLRQVSRDLEASRAEFADLYEFAPVGFVTLNPKGIIHRANAAARQMLTGNEHSMVGHLFSNFVVPEDLNIYFKHTKQPNRKGNASVFDLRLKGTGNRTVHAHVQIFVRFDAEGEVSQTNLVFFDVSEQKQLEEELRESRERFQAVLEHSLDVAFRRNVQTKQYDYLSPVIEQMTGYSVDEVTAMNSEELTDLVHPEDRTRVASEVEQASRVGSGKVDFRLRKKERGYLWVADFFTVQKDPAGNPLYRTGVLRDISSKKLVENALKEKQQVLSEKLLLLERSNRELSEYAYAVSHDLKAPLRAVRNYADFLIEDLEGQLSGEQTTYLEGMKKALSQGDELIRDLLDFARIGEAAEETEAVDLEDLLRDVCEVLNLSEDMQVSVRSGCPPLKTKRTLLNQILVNLIGNGLKFSTADVKRVEVWCRLAPNERMELLVKDNGLGIEERYQKQIFRVFQRLHSAQKYGGTGIGLAIVRKAAARLGGSVRLESTPGEGSTFIVDLPRKPSDG
ncbi:MAG: PAS domain-containing protein [Desulfobacterales bacterium]|nr:PAS domain-containing protein [Desulfobacterales bacterium]